MVPSTASTDQPPESRGGNGGNHRPGGGDGANKPNKARGTSNINGEDKREEGKREDLSVNGERGTFLGSPNFLAAKIAEGRESKKEKVKELQMERKEEYRKDRRRGTTTDMETEGAARKEKFSSVKVKKEQLEAGDENNTFATAMDMTTGEEGKNLVIDLTKRKKGTDEKIKMNIDKERKASKEKAKAKAKKQAKLKKEKEAKAKSKTSPAAKSMIDLTKGIGRAKKTKKVEKTGSEGFDFGIKKSDGGKTSKKKKSSQDGESSPAPTASDQPSEKASSTKATMNVYAGAASRAKARTAKNKQMVLGSRTKYRGTRRFRVTFATKAKRSYQGAEGDLSLTQQAAELRNVLVNILARAQATCKRAGIHPWVGESDEEMPTIVDVAQVPKTWGELRRYMTHDDDQFKIQSVRAGNNARWRVMINFDMKDHEEFLHLYQTSKGQWNEYTYVPIVDAPLQDENYHCLGFLVSSSADQPTSVNEVGITKETKIKVGLSFGNLPMDREYLNTKWDEARNGGGGKRDTFKNAPQATNVYVNEKSLQARAVMAKNMAKVYGCMKEGKYPLFPDGSRMRFMPNHKLVPFNKRSALETYADLQVTLKKGAVELEIGIKDPNKLVKSKEAQGRTIGELILGLSKGENQLPIFRHFTKRYSRKYNSSLWSVSIHPTMSEVAVETLRKLKKIMTEQYGVEAGMLIGTTNNYASKAGVLNSTFKPDDSGFEFLDVSKDWYLSGNAKCMIEGMDAMKETPEEKMAMDNAVRSIDESKMTFLSNVNTADEEKTVATSGGVSFGDTVSRLSYDGEMSASEGHASGEESTVVMDTGDNDVPLTHLEPPPPPTAIQKPAVPDVNMTDASGKNGKVDGTGGSGTRSISDEETWTRHGTAEDERSLFQSAVKYGLKSLVNTFAPVKNEGEARGEDGLGASKRSPGVSHP